MLFEVLAQLLEDGMLLLELLRLLWVGGCYELLLQPLALSKKVFLLLLNLLHNELLLLNLLLQLLHVARKLLRHTAPHCHYRRRLSLLAWDGGAVGIIIVDRHESAKCFQTLSADTGLTSRPNPRINPTVPCRVGGGRGIQPIEADTVEIQIIAATKRNAGVTAARLLYVLHDRRTYSTTGCLALRLA